MLTERTFYNVVFPPTTDYSRINLRGLRFAGKQVGSRKQEVVKTKSQKHQGNGPRRNGVGKNVEHNKPRGKQTPKRKTYNS